MEQLKALAKSKNVSINRAQPVNKFLLLSKVSGKVLGSYQSLEDLAQGLEDLVPEVAAASDPVEYVEWRVEPQHMPQPPRRCPNGHGDMCLCVSDWEDLLCAVRTCHFKSACLGVCQGHYSQIKILKVDLTEAAYAHTQSHEDDGDLEEVKKNPKVVSLKRDGAIPTDGRQQKVDLSHFGELLGLTLRATGSRNEVYQVIDKDGNVISASLSKEELIKEFFLLDE